MFAAVLGILSTHQLANSRILGPAAQVASTWVTVNGINILETNQLSFSLRVNLRAAQLGGSNRRLEFSRE